SGVFLVREKGLGRVIEERRAAEQVRDVGDRQLFARESRRGEESALFFDIVARENPPLAGAVADEDRDDAGHRAAGSAQAAERGRRSADELAALDRTRDLVRARATVEHACDERLVRRRPGPPLDNADQLRTDLPLIPPD